jgi:ATP-binding cassette, subfamily B, bacterial
MGFFGGLDQDKYDRQYTDRQLFQRLWDYFRPHKRRVIGAVLSSLAVSGTFALVPILIASGVGALENDSPQTVLILLVVALLVVSLTQYFGNWLRRRYMGRLVGDVIRQMRKDAFNAAINRDMAFYDENKSGKVLSRITSDTEEFGQVLMFTSDVVTQMTQALILTVLLMTRNVMLTLVLLAFLPIIYLISKVLLHYARITTRQGSRAMAAVNDNIQESVTGISVAKNFRQEAEIYEEFVTVNEQSYSINMKRGFVLALVFPVLNAVAGFAIGGVLYLGARIVVSGVITVSEWYLYVQSVDNFWFPFINIASYGSQFQQALSAAERVFGLIDAENVVNQSEITPANDLRGLIVFDHVTFEYNPGQPVLGSFSLNIAPGESIAFVGHTGAGKSTIIKLITRFYEFQQGSIRIDGQDIRSFDLQTFRRQLGLVPQQPFLFSGTILENARYSSPEATDDAIEKLAHSIGGGEWLETLPDGLQTDVGERGARLSMGQRQLVSLLRVLVQKPAIFILDEATASIDPFTETQIQEALDLILARSTSILIAHRLSTVRSADRIVVLRQGQIIEQGSHESLMKQAGHYAELYDTYFRHQSLSYIETARSQFEQGEAAAK